MLSTSRYCYNLLCTISVTLLAVQQRTAGLVLLSFRQVYHPQGGYDNTYISVVSSISLFCYPICHVIIIPICYTSVMPYCYIRCAHVLHSVSSISALVHPYSRHVATFAHFCVCYSPYYHPKHTPKYTLFYVEGTLTL